VLALLPVPRLIAIWAVLWVIVDTLHDPRMMTTSCQLPVPDLPIQVPDMLTAHISARLLMYPWVLVPVPSRPSPTAIGEPTAPYMLVPSGIGEPYVIPSTHAAVAPTVVPMSSTMAI